MENVVAKIKLIEPEGDHPFYHRYAGQYSPQDAYIEIDFEECTMRADWNAEIGNSVPSRVWHGLVQRFPIPVEATSARAYELMEEIEEWANEALAGFEAVWDGNNWRGKFTEQAREVLEAIGYKCRDLDCSDVCVISEWDDWFSDRSDVIKMLEWGYDVATMEKETKNEIEGNGHIFDVTNDMEGYVIKCAVDEIDTFTGLDEVQNCLDSWSSWATENQEVRDALKEVLERYAEEHLS